MSRVLRELAQGFDPDNLPCSAKMGNFIVTTDARLLFRPFVPGKSLAYPLTIVSNQEWKGEVTLSATTVPAVAGFQVGPNIAVYAAISDSRGGAAGTSAGRADPGALSRSAASPLDMTLSYVTMTSDAII